MGDWILICFKLKQEIFQSKFHFQKSSRIQHVQKLIRQVISVTTEEKLAYSKKTKYNQNRDGLSLGKIESFENPNKFLHWSLDWRKRQNNPGHSRINWSRNHNSQRKSPPYFFWPPYAIRWNALENPRN